MLFRSVRNAEVRGSIPLSSTNKKATRHGWFFIGGKKDFLRGLNTWPWVRGAKSKTTDAPVVLVACGAVLLLSQDRNNEN